MDIMKEGVKFLMPKENQNWCPGAIKYRNTEIVSCDPIKPI